MLLPYRLDCFSDDLPLFCYFPIFHPLPKVRDEHLCLYFVFCLIGSTKPILGHLGLRQEKQRPPSKTKALEPHFHYGRFLIPYEFKHNDQEETFHGIKTL